MHWIHLFLGMGYSVTLVSPSNLKSENEWGMVNLPQGVEMLQLPLNRESIQDELKKISPEIVMFDRFFLEEQYGPHVYSACPDALILMETQDLHFVRRAREGLKENYLATDQLSSDFYHTESALRETGSILRVDYSYVVSSFEEELLRNQFQIPQSKVKWLPFFYDQPVEPKENLLSFQQRKDFCWIGNFLHQPNLDGIRWFHREIWPLIRKQLPNAKIRIFGAYPPKEIMQLSDASQGFEVLGNANSLKEVFQSARVNVAPLRFGAGVKGKIIEGFRFGLPCVTTRVGVEGLFGQFPGYESNTPIDFANACVKLHESEQEWKKYSLMAQEKMLDVCSASLRVPETQRQISEMVLKKKSGQLPDWFSKILRYEGNQSRYYFGKWIEEKEKAQSK